MRVVFAGTPEFAAIALEAILDAGHDVKLVLTQPTRLSGRGLKDNKSAVHQFAGSRALALYQPQSLRTSEATERIAKADPEILVVAAFGLIVPQVILDLPTHGAVNIHASLLPRWRGAAPIQRALLAGDERTGITIMRMDAGLDTGPILVQQATPITAEDDAQTLHDRLARLGADLLVAALPAIETGRLVARPQPPSGVTYAAKITKAEALLDWTLAAPDLERAVRAFRPVPGAATVLHDLPLKVWAARIATGHGEPGTLLGADAGRLVVACGSGALEILELQRPGGRRLAARDFLRGFAVRPGERLGAAR